MKNIGKSLIFLPLLALSSCVTSVPSTGSSITSSSVEQVDKEALKNNVSNMNSYTAKSSFYSKSKYVVDDKEYDLLFEAYDATTKVVGKNYSYNYYQVAKYSKPLSIDEANWGISVEQYFKEVIEETDLYELLTFEVDREKDIYIVEMPYQPYAAYTSYYFYYEEEDVYLACSYQRYSKTTRPLTKINEYESSVTKDILSKAIDNGEINGDTISYSFTNEDKSSYLEKMGETNEVPNRIELKVKNNNVVSSDIYYDMDIFNKGLNPIVFFVPGTYTEYVIHNEYFDINSTVFTYPDDLEIPEPKIDVTGKSFSFVDLEVEYEADSKEDEERIKESIEKTKADYIDSTVVFTDDTFTMTLNNGNKIIGIYYYEDDELKLLTKKMVKDGKEEEFKDFPLPATTSRYRIRVCLGGGGGSSSSGHYSSMYYAVYEVDK